MTCDGWPALMWFDGLGWGSEVLGARVCDGCKRKWPDKDRFKRCPLCDRATRYSSCATPMGDRECEEIEVALAELAVELERAEADALRRGARWSTVDVLLETAPAPDRGEN